MTVHNTHWSKLGVYRGGYALGFDGKSSYATIPNWKDMDSTRNQITIGVVLHTAAATEHATGGNKTQHGSDSKRETEGEDTAEESTSQTIASRPGVWRLSLEKNNTVHWSVNTTAGLVTAVGATELAPIQGNAWVVRATYNSTSGNARLFVGGKGQRPKEDGSAFKPYPGAKMVPYGKSSTGVWIGADATDSDSAASAPQPAVRSVFHGAMEELYFKNVSAEHRIAYVYADNNRFAGTYLIDLTVPAGRHLFASAINNVLNQANFSAVQYDGFEKLQLIAAVDFEHSSATVDSGMFRGPPNPDWYAHCGLQTALPCPAIYRTAPRT